MNAGLLFYFRHAHFDIIIELRAICMAEKSERLEFQHRSPILLAPPHTPYANRQDIAPIEAGRAEEKEDKEEEGK